MTIAAPNKSSAAISTVLTVILLVVIAILSMFFEVLTLNGASEKQGTIALGLSLICNGLGVLVIGIFSGRFTNFAINKLNWNKALAVGVAVTVGVICGTVISFSSLIASIVLAGVR
jgi:membrane protease YdiL (CAAX protease family)